MIVLCNKKGWIRLLLRFASDIRTYIIHQKLISPIIALCFWGKKIVCLQFASIVFPFTETSKYYDRELSTDNIESKEYVHLDCEISKMCKWDLLDLFSCLWFEDILSWWYYEINVERAFIDCIQISVPSQKMANLRHDIKRIRIYTNQSCLDLHWRLREHADECEWISVKNVIGF